MKKRIVLSTLDQGILSVLNFVVNLILIKVWSLESYGTYTVVFSIGLFLVGLQNALVNTPYSIDSVNKPEDKFDFALVNVVFCIVSPLIATALFYLYLSVINIDISLASVFLYLVSVVFKEYFRAKWIVDNKVQNALLSDVVFVSLLSLLYCFYLFGNTQIDFNLENLLYAFAFSSLISIFIPLIAEIWGIFTVTIRSAFDYAEIWKQAKWSLVGVFTTELQNRGYIYIVGLFFGLSVLGLLQAGRVFFGPLNLLVAGWSRVARPFLAAHFNEKQYTKFTCFLVKSSTGFIGTNILFFIAIVLFWDSINLYLYQNKYENIFYVVLQWAGVNLLTHIRTVYSVGLQATNKFDLLARSTIVGACVSFFILFIVVLIDQPLFSVSSIFISEACALVIIYCYLTSQLNKSAVH